MKSKSVFIKGRNEAIEEALNEAEAFCGKCGTLSRKQMLQMRLLTEELLGIMKGITGDYNAMFWIQQEGTQYELHLCAKAEVDGKVRKEFLSVSSTGKNVPVKGVMNKIGRIMEQFLIDSDGVSKGLAAAPGGLGPHFSEGEEVLYLVGDMQPVWSLQAYSEYVEEQGTDESEEWDELEKSIVAKLADDVQVDIYKDKIDIVIKKNFGNSSDRSAHILRRP